MKTLYKDNVRIDIIDDPKTFDKFINWLSAEREKAGNVPFGLDFEGTALFPREGRIRLSQYCLKPGRVYIIDHDKTQSFQETAHIIAGCGPYYAFNVNFEGRWLDEYAPEAVELHDVGHMRRACEGGGPLNLATMCKWDLGVTLDKELQMSDWGAPELTDEQYIYAAMDAHYTKQLGDDWRAKMTDEQFRGFLVINDSWRAVNECFDTGMLIDVEYHKTLIAMWTKRRQAAEKAFRKLVPEHIMPNIRSKIQFSNMLKMILDDNAIEQWPKTDKTAQLQSDRKLLREMSYHTAYPFSRMLAAYMVFNRADKYLSTYGETLLTKQDLSSDGRLRGRLNTAAAITTRFSSSNPNMQNIPRSPVVRRSFIAGKGRKLILADYSGIEIRVLAEMSGDQILLHDAIYGDVHAQSAIQIYNELEELFMQLIKKKDPTAKEKRSKAKGFTFQLTYGAGTGALAIVLRTSIDGAAEAVKKWASRYQKAYNLRFYMKEKLDHTGYLPLASGATIYVPKRERSLPVASNYPIQGSAAAVMYRAMYHVRRLLIERGIDAWMMNSVHDELLLLADDDEENCKRAAAALEEGMKLGWLDIFPGTSTDNLIEAVPGDSWADKA
jgi:DNA polymerase-1